MPCSAGSPALSSPGAGTCPTPHVSATRSQAWPLSRTGSDRTDSSSNSGPLSSLTTMRWHEMSRAQALTATGFDSRALTATPAPSFAKLTAFPEPNPAQATVGSVDSHARLVILEAETGSGKTEAALWRFARLLAAGVVSGLYFAVPTRAAARQLHGRVDKALRRAFGAAAPEAVLAIPGMLRAGRIHGPTSAPLACQVGRRCDNRSATMGGGACDAVPGRDGCRRNRGIRRCSPDFR